MWDWLISNLGTIIVGLVVAGVVAAIVAKLVKDKRKGKSVVCGCSCTGCSSANGCNPNK